MIPIPATGSFQIYICCMLGSCVRITLASCLSILSNWRSLVAMVSVSFSRSALRRDRSVWSESIIFCRRDTSSLAPCDDESSDRWRRDSSSRRRSFSVLVVLISRLSRSRSSVSRSSSFLDAWLVSLNLPMCFSSSALRRCTYSFQIHRH